MQVMSNESGSRATAKCKQNHREAKVYRSLRTVGDTCIVTESITEYRIIIIGMKESTILRKLNLQTIPGQSLTVTDRRHSNCGLQLKKQTQFGCVRITSQEATPGTVYEK